MVKDTSQFDEDFVKNCNEESDKGYFLEVDVQYLEKLHEFHNDLLFLSKRMKIEKFEKLVANLNDKTEYVMHIRNLKQALNYGLFLKNLPRIIKFKQKAWLKSYIGMNTDIRKNSIMQFLEILWKMSISSYHVIYAFQNESTLCSFLNVKELLAQNRCEI